jgi:hypothetical protein
MRWVVGSILACMAALVVVGNLVGGARAMRSGRSFSAVPFVGGVLAVLAILVLPVENRSRLLPAVLLLDFTFPSAMLALTRGAFRRPRPPRAP